MRISALPVTAVLMAGLVPLASPADAASPALHLGAGAHVTGNQGEKSPQSAKNTKRIKALAAEAYTWGLAPQFVYRFSKYNSFVNAPINKLKYGSVPAAWNNSATNAGDASVLYLNSFIDFTKVDELVLTVPPSAENYFVVNYLDNFINTVGSIGTRTTPSARTTTYLLVGPDSKYAGRTHVTLKGKRYRVMASDTNLNWMLIRVRANGLIDPTDPSSTTSVTEKVEHKFALNTLKSYQGNSNAPVYPDEFVTEPSQADLRRAQKWSDTPQRATVFMKQLGVSLRKSPLPTKNTALTGTPLKELPSWVSPQYDAKKIYRVPSYPQQKSLDRFAPLGLTANGYEIPANWGKRQLKALQAGFEEGIALVDKASNLGTPSAAKNFWTYDNTMVGTYKNSRYGYLMRAVIVINGGSANLPADAVYPVVNSIDGSTQLNGNNTYSLTFKPPTPWTSGQVMGTMPPMVTDSSGNVRGFWSITLYQPDSSEVSAPFLPQSALLNRYYSKASSTVLSVDATADTVTVPAQAWGPLVKGAAVLFGSDAADYGLQADAVYYVAADPSVSGSGTSAKYTFPVSATWPQTLSDNNVPIQSSGGPGPVVDLTSPSGAATMTFGMVQPVSQLGSQQVTSGDLKANPDGSITIWVAPTLPAGVPAGNWLPSPSTAEYSALYPGKTVNTDIRLMLRMYYPTPGDQPPSILPYDSGSTRLSSTWLPPAVTLN